MPTENVGAFQAPVSYIPTLESFSADGGWAHVPVLKNSKVKIASKLSKHPVLSSKSLVSVFSCLNRITGLPKHLEYIHRDDLTLEVLKKIFEFDLAQLPEGSQLSVIVTDFRIDVNLTAAQNCSILDSILRLISSHPKGNAIRFAQVHFYPKHCKLQQMKDKRIPTPAPNYYPLFRDINNHLMKAMNIYGIGSTLGSYRRNNFGLSGSLSHCNAYNWEGVIAGVPESILNCERLTPAVCKQRCVFLVRSIECELNAMVGK